MSNPSILEWLLQTHDRFKSSHDYVVAERYPILVNELEDLVAHRHQNVFEAVYQRVRIKSNQACYIFKSSIKLDERYKSNQHPVIPEK